MVCSRYDRSATMANYRIRPAGTADLDTPVHHRMAMFADMGVAAGGDDLAAAFRAWVAPMLAAGAYRAWLVDTRSGETVAGGGMTILPWPPGPQYPANRIAFVYNVYTE